MMTLDELKKLVDERYEEAMESKYKPKDIKVLIEDSDGYLDYVSGVMYVKDNENIILW